MAEYVQRRKEDMIVEINLLEILFKKSIVKRIVHQREKFEYRMMRRNKQKSDFTQYIVFLKSVMKKIQKLGLENAESLKLIEQHISRINTIYRTALKYFKDDISLWKEYIKFLVKAKRFRLLQYAIDSALLLHGHISDEIYVFAIRQEFLDLKNIQKARELYTTGLRLHKKSSSLYLEAFDIELTYSEILTQTVIKKKQVYKPDDPALNGSIAKAIFLSAIDNVANDFSLFFKMYQKTKDYNFASYLNEEIRNFLQTNFSSDPIYWNTIANNELNHPKRPEKLRIKNCLDKYDEALSIVDTDEMWNLYLNTLLQITSDTNKTEAYKRNLLRHSMFNAHAKNRLKPIHYVQWVNKSKSSITNEILEWALEKYPNDPSILEVKIKNLVESDKFGAYEIFKQHMNLMSVNVWLLITEKIIEEPQAKEIFEIVFSDISECDEEVKKKLGSSYLYWLSRNNSLECTRNAFQKLIMSTGRDSSLCNTIIKIETEQEKMDIHKIRQHFIIACMQFGKTDKELWMDRILFELKYGSPKTVSNVYHEALTTLNNEESDEFVELYTKKILNYNK
ncbi:U3 small nucleolar RNA-associated protein 6 homolog [Daktulosphaira vitifoliae]|uniref:U3 small nucleolar RNA-associated protein 6 homolog n=1 Tax=Daktulosphaira vitifoliae TaxID=58002 RepID=UPI0021A999FE|nr:U3 small nucleolar RNA-associated protein 6 homolog [Daktulosphaira vitifoliae]